MKKVINRLVGFVLGLIYLGINFNGKYAYVFSWWNNLGIVKFKTFPYFYFLVIIVLILIGLKSKNRNGFIYYYLLLFASLSTVITLAYNCWVFVYVGFRTPYLLILLLNIVYLITVEYKVIYNRKD